MRLSRIPLPRGMIGALFATGMPGSIAGVPLERLLQELRERSIDRIVSLCGDEELLDRAPGYFGWLVRGELGVAVDRFPLADWGVPEDPGAFLELAGTTAERLRLGQHVLVHCHGGCGRTGTFCACVLVALGRGVDEAIAAFRAARGCGPETRDQREFVERASLRLGP